MNAARWLIVLALTGCVSRPLALPKQHDLSATDLEVVDLSTRDLVGLDLVGRDLGPPDLAPPADLTPVGTSPIGAACKLLPASTFVTESSGTCAPDLYCLPVSAGFPDGYCSKDCGPPMFTCPDNSVCVWTVPGCFLLCTRDSDCRKGYKCDAEVIASGSICVPK